MVLAGAIMTLGLALQEPPSWTARAESTADGVRVEVQSPTEDFWFSVGAFGRYSWPGGALEDHDVIISGNTVIIPDHLRYSDLFDPGGGFSTEASAMIFRPPPPRQGGFRFGTWEKFLRLCGEVGGLIFTHPAPSHAATNRGICCHTEK